jgi:hypothetical protein
VRPRTSGSYAIARGRTEAGRPRRTSAPIPGRIDQRPEVPGRLGGAAAPELLQAGHVLGGGRLPEEIGELAAERVLTAVRRREPAGGGALPKRGRAFLRDEIAQRPPGAGGEHLPHPGDARAADREDIDAREPRAHPHAVERAPSAQREVRREAGEEAREEHVVAGREVHAARGVAAAAHREVEGRADDGHVRLAPVRDGDERARLRREALAVADAHAEGRARVGPHAVSDGVVEIGHVYILAAWRA